MTQMFVVKFCCISCLEMSGSRGSLMAVAGGDSDTAVLLVCTTFLTLVLPIAFIGIWFQEVCANMRVCCGPVSAFRWACNISYKMPCCMFVRVC